MNQHWWCSTFAVFIFLYMIQYLPYCKPFFLQPTPTQIHMYTYKLDSSCANIKRKWMQKHCAAVNLHCSNQFETCTVSVYKLVKGKKKQAFHKLISQNGKSWPPEPASCSAPSGCCQDGAVGHWYVPPCRWWLAKRISSDVEGGLEFQGRTIPSRKLVQQLAKRLGWMDQKKAEFYFVGF